MKKPTKYEKNLSILILRTLGLSQDDVKGIVGCGKSTVVKLERWIRQCDQHEVNKLCDDQAMKRLVEREFPRLKEMSDDIFNRAVQLRGEDILRHYREDFITKQAVEAPLVREAKRKHTLELRSTLTEWMNLSYPMQRRGG
jgi:hypothetical protein